MLDVIPVIQANLQFVGTFPPDQLVPDLGGHALLEHLLVQQVCQVPIDSKSSKENIFSSKSGVAKNFDTASSTILNKNVCLSAMRDWLEERLFLDGLY